jgi:hypothetical protein
VQSVVTQRWPEAIFLPIETTGDGAVNVDSRVQMMLFKARNKARAEFDAALKESGVDEETFKKRAASSRRLHPQAGRPSGPDDRAPRDRAPTTLPGRSRASAGWPG